MRPIPDSWDDRVPKRINVKRQTQCFHDLFHEGLLAHGFVCQGDQMPTEKKPNIPQLVAMTRYYRVIDGKILQSVVCPLREIDTDKMTVYRNGYMSAPIHTPVFSLYDDYRMTDPLWGWIGTPIQQRLVDFRFPNMGSKFCASFSDLYVDDFRFAMELEKELFFEQTIPWLEAHKTFESYNQYCITQWDKNDHHGSCSHRYIWSFLHMHQWDKVLECCNAQLEGTRKLMERNPKIKFDSCQKYYLELERCALDKDTEYARKRLIENYEKNVKNLLETVPKLKDQLANAHHDL